MKFLYLPTKGKPSFVDADPFDFIKEMGKKVCKDYFHLYVDIDLSDSKGICNLKFTPGIGVIFFNDTGQDILQDARGGKATNKVATSFYNAYGAVYEGNMCNIYSECIVVKTTDYTHIEEITQRDATKLRRMLKDANKWF